MFDLQIPDTWACLPGRVHVCRDDPVAARKTAEERRQQMREYAARRKAAMQKPIKPFKPRLTAEELAMDDVTYLATNRERIAKRRKELAAQKRNPQQQLRASNRSN